jgi:CRISPR-associated endoribonuclease Cas6
MRLTVKFKLAKELRLPLSYQQVLQGFIYHTLSNSELSKFLHEKGYVRNGRVFKLFTFSRLQGKYTIDPKQKKIIFEDEVKWIISSVLPEFIQDLGQSLLTTSTHQLNGQDIHVEEIVYSQREINHEKIDISMLSPITIHSTYKTDTGKKITQFFGPQDQVFPHLIQENIRKKYSAYYGEQSEKLLLDIRPTHVNKKDKVITRFKNFIINGWGGEYEVSGSPELIRFAHCVGLGGRNSQGFGMFEVN